MDRMSNPFPECFQADLSTKIIQGNKNIYLTAWHWWTKMESNDFPSNDTPENIKSKVIRARNGKVSLSGTQSTTKQQPGCLTAY